MDGGDGERGTYSSFAIRQTGAQPGAGELRDHRVAVGVYELSDGSLRRTHRVEVDVTGEVTEVPELVGVPAGDVVLVNDDDLSYCFMELDPASKTFLVDHIGDFADPMPRTLAWSTMWEMTRAAKVRARDFVDLVLRGAPAEDQISVLERVLAQAVAAVERYADPQWAAETGRARLGEGLLAHARAAEPGSDAQLAFVNALAMLPADAAGSVEVFRAILAGTPEDADLAGLTVDADMTWKALTVLVAAGDKGADDISAAERDDQSALGAQSAAKARAAIPEANNKIRVWNTCTATGAAAPSNLMLRSMMAGFAAPGSDDLLREFTDRYFAEAPGWWAEYSSETAQRMLDGLYPHWEVSREGLDKASALLDDDSTPTPVKRIVAENRDRVARALDARACDGESGE